MFTNLSKLVWISLSFIKLKSVEDGAFESFKELNILGCGITE